MAWPWRINDDGWIVGYGFGGGEYTRGFVLKPLTSSCYADCDASGTLSIDDFLCFINEFAQAQSLPPSQQVTHYTNCDGSTTEPILTVDDFICFLNEFAAGCP
jgi:hypothetical protein